MYAYYPNKHTHIYTVCIFFIIYIKYRGRERDGEEEWMRDGEEMESG